MNEAQALVAFDEYGCSELTAALNEYAGVELIAPELKALVTGGRGTFLTATGNAVCSRNVGCLDNVACIDPTTLNMTCPMDRVCPQVLCADLDGTDVVCGQSPQRFNSVC
jgi:hypothetical protein